MVNFGLGSASILGIFLAVAGAGLYFLRSVRPELARDHDIFFAAVGLLCGFILMFQGWRLDPILQFGQLLLAGSAIFFAVESIRLRGAATEQAKRNTRIVDEERPVSSVYEYQAELDELEPIYEEQRINPRRRIQGTRETRPARTSEYDDEPRRSTDDYEDEPRRRALNRSNNSEQLGSADRPTKRRRSSRPTSRPTTERPNNDQWNYPQQSGSRWEDEASSEPPQQQRRSSRSSESDTWGERESSDTSSRPRKRRSPSTESTRRSRNVEPAPSDYVDYKPIDPLDSDDNSRNFDEI